MNEIALILLCCLLLNVPLAFVMVFNPLNNIIDDARSANRMAKEQQKLCEAALIDQIKK